MCRSITLRLSFAFPWLLIILSMFSFAYFLSMYLFGWSACTNLLFIYLLGVLFSYYWDFRACYTFWKKTFYQVYALQMFSPYYTSVSSLFSHYFLKSKIFSFDDVLFINIFFLVHAFGIVSKKSLPNQRSHKFPPLFSSVSFLFLGFAFMSMIFLRGFFLFCFFWGFFLYIV